MDVISADDVTSSLERLPMSPIAHLYVGRKPLPLSHTYSLSRSLSLSHTHTHTRAYSLPLAQTLSVSGVFSGVDVGMTK